LGFWAIPALDYGSFLLTILKFSKVSSKGYRLPTKCFQRRFLLFKRGCAALGGLGWKAQAVLTLRQFALSEALSFECYYQKLPGF
jgi:hypothetical protein